MKVHRADWQKAVQHLLNRRMLLNNTNDNIKSTSGVSDYSSHLRKVYLGASILDVGCGSCYIKECLKDKRKLYYGLDAFPIYKEIYHGMIEDEIAASYFIDKRIDTVIAFAVLDNCMDFDKAIDNIKKIALKNVVILTGINIQPSIFHTHLLQLEDFRNRFSGWEETYCEDIENSVYLLEYRNPKWVR